MIVENAPRKKDRNEEQPPLFPEDQKIPPATTGDEAAKRGREVGAENEKERLKISKEKVPYWQKD